MTARLQFNSNSPNAILNDIVSCFLQHFILWMAHNQEVNKLIQLKIPMLSETDLVMGLSEEVKRKIKKYVSWNHNLSSVVTW